MTRRESEGLLLLDGTRNATVIWDEYPDKPYSNYGIMFTTLEKPREWIAMRDAPFLDEMR